jgi:hypothetical protein
MEHRCGSRVEVDMPVRLVSRPGAIGLGRLLNVSLSGAYVQTDLQPEFLALVRLELTETPGARAARMPADSFVVRSSLGGIGLEWCAAPPKWIAQLLHADDEPEPHGHGLLCVGADIGTAQPARQNNSTSPTSDPPIFVR